MSRAGTIFWFAHHEWRLAWRDCLWLRSGRRRSRRRVVLGLIAIVLFLHGFAYLVLYRSADLPRLPDQRMLVMLTGMLALYGSMMLSQAMEAVTRAFYGRGDLDLILSSPVAAWRLFAVRIGAIAVTIAAMSLALAAPFINILAWFSGLRWLAGYGVIVALAMVTVAVAVMLTVGLFRTIGPKYTRLGAQIVAAVIGASFAIGVQLAAILCYGTPSRLAFLQSEAVTRYAPDSGSTLWLPARAILGDMLALVVVFGIGAIMFAATICILAPRFGQLVLAGAIGFRTGLRRGLKYRCNIAVLLGPTSTVQSVLCRANDPCTGDDCEGDKSGDSGEPRAGCGQSAGAGPAARRQRLGKSGDTRRSLAAAKVASLCLHAKPELN